MLLARKTGVTCWLLCLGLVAASHAAPVMVKFKSDEKPVVLSEETTREFLTELKARPTGTLHGLVALPSHPTAAERAALESAGLHVLSPVYSTIYRVRVEAKWLDSPAGAQPLPAVTLARLEAKHRVDPELGEPVPPGSKSATPVDCLKAPDPAGGAGAASPKPVNVTVRVHNGTTEEQLAGVLQKFLRCEKQSDETWLATLTRESLWELAEDDVVQWIDAGPRPFRRENDVSRKIVRADSVQRWRDGQIRGLGGQNVQVGLFELGIDDMHEDVRRRIRRDSSMPVAEYPSLHATLMAGIIAGDGTMSDRKDSRGDSNKGTRPHQWRGMAPKAELLDINRRQPDGPNGANAAVHLNFINKPFGMDLSIHSYTVNTDGSYDNSNQARDQLIRGDAAFGGEPVPARLHVTSAGNEAGYFGLTKQMKNALVVGNWDSAAKQLDGLVSLGPTLDGRIKPDVVAPGSFLKSPGVCALESREIHAEPLCRDSDNNLVSRHNFYSKYTTGSSQAAAVTTGAVALMLERYVRTYKVALDWNPPLPSTLRAVTIHTARDLHSETSWFPLRKVPVWPKRGPDFATGWGLIDTHAATRTIAARHLLQDAVTKTCDEIVYSFVVPRGGGKGRVRVTLAWDDVAADAALAGTVPKLVNDLDLVLVDPKGKPHYPWQLDQKGNSGVSCGSPVAIERSFVGNLNNPPAAPVPSAQHGPDHLNNVEVVDAPRKVGRWEARVLAFNVPQGPQRFSLIGAAFEKARTGTAQAPTAGSSAAR